MALDVDCGVGAREMEVSWLNVMVLIIVAVFGSHNQRFDHVTFVAELM